MREGAVKNQNNFLCNIGLNLGHALASFAWLSSGFVNHCSLCFAKQIPSEVGLVQDNFSDEKFVLFTSLTERGLVVHCSLCFAKQVPSDLGLVQDNFSDEKFVLT